MLASEQPAPANTGQRVEQTLSNEDAPIHAVKLGCGWPVILLHGWGQSILSFRPLGELLARFLEVHLIDLPGFGDSPLPPDDWGTSDYARRIESYITEGGLVRPIIIGHSFGGRVAVQLASRKQCELGAMVLVNAHGIPNTDLKKAIRGRSLKYLAQFLKAVDKLTGAKMFQNWFVPRFASRDYKNAGRLKNILVKAVNEDLSQKAAAIDVATLLLWGELDQETPPALGRRYHALIQNSRLIVMPNKDHFPFQGGGEHLCARYILDFLSDCNVGKTP